jgi:hypothetical protein
MARRLKSEAEQAAWYASPEGRRQTQREFEAALKRGTLVRAHGLAVKATDSAILADLMRKAKEKATQAISLRVPVADLERAKRIASRKGIGYQTVLKEAIRTGLSRVS